jgi:O-antigen biosynthesis protein
MKIFKQITVRLDYAMRRALHLLRRTIYSYRQHGFSVTAKKITEQLSSRFQANHVTPIERVSAEDLSRFKPSRKPKVSVIIPVFNKWEITHLCLAALYRNTDSELIEVIVVDDASADQTQRVLHDQTFATYVRLDSNQGYIAACNAGTKKANGEFICFLNNDTEVQKDWLTSMLCIYEQHKKTGAVVAQLLYPNGRLQEAGGVIFSDGSAWNYGKNRDPYHPRYQYVRECDYGSGACLLLKKELFDQVGGFDTLYSPAYYEDTDLAMKIRALGLRVLYQPKARILHVEGGTAGVDESQGHKQYQSANALKFAEKWKNDLAAFPSSKEVNDIDEFSHWRSKRNVLWIDSSLPFPGRDAGSLRAYELCKAMIDLGCHIEFFADDRSAAPTSLDWLQQAGVLVWTKEQTPAAPAFIRENGHRYSHIIVSRHFVFHSWLKLLKQYAPQAKLIFDTVDLHGLREHRENIINKKATDLHLNSSLDQEINLINVADETWLVSAAEYDFLSKRIAASDIANKVRIISNTHHISQQHPIFDQCQDLLFVGNFRHSPNRDGIMWFCENVWALVKKRLTEIQCNVVGDYLSPTDTELLKSRGIQYCGPQDDIEFSLRSHRINIAPLRFGAGVKGKITQSLAHGLPVVTTSIGAEGIPEAEKAMLIEDGPDAFANAICELYQNEQKWRALQSEGLRIAEAYFSPDAAKKNLKAALGL